LTVGATIPTRGMAFGLPISGQTMYLPDNKIARPSHGCQRGKRGKIHAAACYPAMERPLRSAVQLALPVQTPEKTWGGTRAPHRSLFGSVNALTGVILGGC